MRIGIERNEKGQKIVVARGIGSGDSDMPAMEEAAIKVEDTLYPEEFLKTVANSVTPEGGLSPKEILNRRAEKFAEENKSRQPWYKEIPRKFDPTPKN
jgi:hypothetical protein